MNNRQINESIKRAIKFIANKQQDNGSFSGWSSSQVDFLKYKSYNSIFPSAIVLGCLNETNCELSQKIKNKIAEYLLKQKSEHWTWNYWERRSRESAAMSLPDDMDDTFCALSSLFVHNQSIFSGEVLAKIVSVLTELEAREGGPYKTWAVSKKAKKVWQDVDLAVNSNIGYFLFLQDVELASINKIVEDATSNYHFKSKYYPSEYPVLYFMSRFYRGNCVDKLRTYIKKLLLQKGNLNSLDAALLVLSHLNLGGDIGSMSELVKNIMSQQKTDGSWSAHPFCLDPAIDGEKHYAGVPAVTSAFCVEALQKFLQASQPENQHAAAGTQNRNNPAGKDHIHNNYKNNDRTSDYHQLHERTIERVEKRFGKCSKEVQKEAQKIISKIKAGDSHNIIGLPKLFYKSLNIKSKITEELLPQLSYANFLGWMAYTIYDDIMDVEGKPIQLPIANIALRELNKVFADVLPRESGFFELSQRVLDITDSASAWEVANCRPTHITANSIPEFEEVSKLAEKSLGHVLTPMAVVLSLGYEISSKEARATFEIFKQYLVARQLNDDAHDWLEDLKRNQVNFVGAEVVKRAYKKKVSLNDEVGLQQIFWFEVSEEICKLIENCVRIGEEEMRSVNIINYKKLKWLYAPITDSVEKTRRERREAIRFIENFSYNKNNEETNILYEKRRAR